MTSGLEVNLLSRRFGRHEVLRSLSLSAPDGCITALVGRNGAGKSTLFKILMGLINADSGSASLRGHDLLSCPLHGKWSIGLGYLPQESASFPDLTVEENLKALVEILPVSKSQGMERMQSLLAITGLEPVATKPYRWLSGGEQRRLEIAKALVAQPGTVLMDEPFSGLDPAIVEGIIELLQRLAASGVGILLTDHNVHMTLPAVDYVYLLEAGEIRCEGKAHELVADDWARATYFGKSFAP